MSERRGYHTDTTDGQWALIEAAIAACAGRPRAGWLRLLADTKLRPALTLMHQQPARPWRLEELARARPCPAAPSRHSSGPSQANHR